MLIALFQISKESINQRNNKRFLTVVPVFPAAFIFLPFPAGILTVINCQGSTSLRTATFSTV
jgi:hypothetical protein